MFAGVLRCFASVLQHFHKTHKTPEKHRITLENTKNSQYARVLRAISKSQKFRLYCTKHFSQNICKTPQNTAKQSQNVFCEITSQNTAKLTQNAQDCHKTVAIQPQYILRAFSVFFKNTLDLSRKYTIRNIRVHFGGGGGPRIRRGSRSRIVDVF